MKTYSKIYCEYLSQTYDKGIFLDSWKVGRVQPIFKKGSKTIRSNYRSILFPLVVGNVIDHKHIWSNDRQ